MSIQVKYNNLLKDFQGDKVYVTTQQDLFNLLFVHFSLSCLNQFEPLKTHSEFNEWFSLQEKEHLEYEKKRNQITFKSIVGTPEFTLKNVMKLLRPNNKPIEKIMFFDIETTGLPKRMGFNKYYSYKDVEKYSDSRIVEFSYIITNGGVEEKRYKTFIKPQGYTINNSNIHGITNDMALKDGIEMRDFIQNIKEDLLCVDLIVSHNLKFDINIFLSELFRENQEDLIEMIKNVKKLCTMNLGEKLILKKIPKLGELYTYFFPNETYTQTHRALDDTITCMKCYFKILDRHTQDELLKYTI